MHSKHPGFKKAAKDIASRQDLPLNRAQAILASGTRKAGPEARKKNPRLNRVKGKLDKKD